MNLRHLSVQDSEAVQLGLSVAAGKCRRRCRSDLETVYGLSISGSRCSYAWRSRTEVSEDI